jgi:hypothetical protein
MIELDLFGSGSEGLVEIIGDYPPGYEVKVLGPEEIMDLPDNYCKKGFVNRITFEEEKGIVDYVKQLIYIFGVEYSVISGYFPVHVESRWENPNEYRDEW